MINKKIFMALAVLLAFSCSENKSEERDAGLDSSSIMEAGSDTDNDTDSDTDADTDSDNDTDSDTDSDSDTDADADADSDVHGVQCIWAKVAGGWGWDSAGGFSIDSDSSILIGGTFYDTATFGDGESNETYLNSGEDREQIFVAKYESDGDLEWAKAAGDDYADAGPGCYDGGIITGHSGRDIDGFSDGSSIVTGSFHGEATFGIDEAGEKTLYSTGSNDNSDIFFAKYNADGTFSWVKSAGGTESDLGFQIKVLSDNKFIISGQFKGSATFGRGETGEKTLGPSGDTSDIFIAKHKPDGDLIWVSNVEMNDWGHVNGLEVLNNGSVYITGNYYGTAVFGMDESSETELQSQGESDVYIARYNSDGTFAWAETAGGSGRDISSDIISLNGDSLIITGKFTPDATFGGEVLDTGTIFIAQYSSDGTMEWVSGNSGDSNTWVSGISVLPDGDLIILGTFKDTARFGIGKSNETTLLNSGDPENAFMAGYDSNGDFKWARIAFYTQNSLMGLVTKDIECLSDGTCIITGGFGETGVFGPEHAGERVLYGGDVISIVVAKFKP